MYNQGGGNIARGGAPGYVVTYFEPLNVEDDCMIMVEAELRHETMTKALLGRTSKLR